MKKLLSLLVMMMCFTAVHAQTYSIDNVIKMNSGSAKEIREGTEVKGYYFFFISDKIDKRTNEYTLRIMDNNLKMLKDIKFQDSKDVAILETSFNGADLIFLFYNENAKTLEYQIFGADGKKKPFNYTRNLTKKEKNYLEQTYLANSGDEEQTYKGLYPIEGKGFISNMPSREEKHYTYQLDYFSTEKRKQWSYIPAEGAKRFVGDYLGMFNGVVYVEELRYGGAFDQKPGSFIIGLDLETGKKLFEKSTDGKYRFYPASLSQANSGQSFIYGEFFNIDGNIAKDKSLGFAFWGIDAAGNITSEKYISWASDMARFINVSSKGKIEDIGFMFLHNIIQASNGSIYAIGEGYKKNADGVGIAMKMLGGGGSAVKIKVTDMILIKFDSDFKVKDMKIYQKNDNAITLPPGSELLSAPLLGKMIKYYYNGFDYTYTQSNKDVSAFTICYSNYVRSKDYKGGTFNSISYNNGKITTDQIKTRSDATSTWVLPGKQGQVLIIDYYKKTKKVEAHFEKLN